MSPAPRSVVPRRRARPPADEAWSAERLLARAERARAKAYAPYSKFAVGAALLGRSGRVYGGCNVENASYGLSSCAERIAVFKAVSEGEREFEAIAIAAPAGQEASPCGACRQVMHEFAPRLWVYWRDSKGRVVRKRVAQLLDRGFSFDRKRQAR